MAFQGQLSESPERLFSCLEELFSSERKLAKLYAYAHMRHDENLADPIFKEKYDRISLLYHEFQQAISWVSPEILSFPESLFAKYLHSSVLKNYVEHLKKVWLLKPYTLSGDKEHILALAGQSLSVSYRTFGVFNDVDLSFSDIEDQEGKKHELTHGTYLVYLQSYDRTLRCNAFLTMHNHYKQFENTLSELINGHVQTHLFNTRVRGYESCLHQAMIGNQIDIQVYHNLVDTVRGQLPILHRYVKMRKNILQVEGLHNYDLYVSLVPESDKKYTFQEASEIVLDSLSPLGKEYQEVLRKGFYQERWVDRYENEHKRSGAYSMCCYDSCPFMLMNFQGTFNDLMTLTHESGHSMHSYYSHRHQPYHYAHYPIFLAEIASTLNEELLFRYLMQKTDCIKERAYLVNRKMDHFRTTLLRQMQFAEFELRIHQLAEKGVSLMASTIKDLYLELVREYYGPDLVIDQELSLECIRIPHFYANFYVYQYATGISAAYTLADMLIEDPERGIESCFTFLSAGASIPPLELLKGIGVDLTIPDPILHLIQQFDSLINEFESLHEQLQSR